MLHGEIKTSFFALFLLPHASVSCSKDKSYDFFSAFYFKNNHKLLSSLHGPDHFCRFGWHRQRPGSQPPTTTAHLFASCVSQRCGRAKAGRAANNLMAGSASGLSCPSPSLAEQLSISDSFNLQYWHAEEEIMHTSFSLFVFPCCSSHPVWGHMV